MPDKKRALGQYETPENVADLLLSFCLHSAGDRLLDPSCGSGAFLKRASLWKQWLSSDRQAADDSLWGVEVDVDAAEMAQRTLPQANIVQRSFFELELWPAHIFDVIVGNPPYTRAEWIGTYVEDEEQAEQLTMFSGPEVSRGQVVERELRVQADILHKRSGLHAYFFLQGTQFLREGGRFGFVVPNSWLDVAYGERLKQFLLDHYQLIAFIESSVERWFDTASVNTCLIVLKSCSDARKRSTNRVSFVQLLQPLEKLIPFASDSSERLGYLRRLGGQMLEGTATRNEQFVSRSVVQGTLAAGEKWGVVLRAPEVYQRYASAPELHPLKNWAVIQRGYTTGANDFFYLEQEKVDQWGIEPQYLRPLLKSLRHVHVRRVTRQDSRFWLLSVGADSDLSGTAVIEYIRWGESQGVHRRRTTAARTPWYALPEQQEADLITAKGIWERHFTPFLVDNMAIDQQIYLIKAAEGVFLPAAFAFLNSVWAALQFELDGRVNFGEGVLWLAAYELENVLMPDPRYLADRQLAALAEAARQLEKQPVSSVDQEMALPAVQQLDDVVFDVIGMSQVEREAMKEALLERVAIRRIKARSIGQAQAE